ncbi:glycosyltransferase [Silvibacterium acidisoli]|uniref:glycosyltransferase n=1 Tax=Acidobacteriaceae bacterium ZG23-2 TaxID=2883246 RepID=UPI00406CD2C8
MSAQRQTSDPLVSTRPGNAARSEAAKTVLIYRDELLPTSETFIQTQAAGLQRYRARYVGVVRSSPSLPNLEDAVLAIPPAHPSFKTLRIGFYYKTGFAPRFYREIAASGPSLIHAHFAASGQNALRLARRLGVPLIVTLHGYDVTVARDYRAFLGQLWKDASAFICVSDAIRQKALEVGFPEDKLRVLYNGISLVPSPPTYKEPGMILFVGRLVEKKGCSYLLRAMRAVAEKCPEARLILIGDGPLLAELKKEANELRVPCDFLGSQPKHIVRRYQERASIACVPSVTASNGDSEGLPTVVLEAMRVGAMVVATNHSGIPEAVVDRSTGLLVPEKSSDALAEALIEAIQNEDLRKHCVRQSLVSLEARFDAVKQAALLEQIYDEVIHAHRSDLSRRGALRTG